MGHRDPTNVDMWKLAARGTALWEQEAADVDGYVSFVSLFLAYQRTHHLRALELLHNTSTLATEHAQNADARQRRSNI